MTSQMRGKWKLMIPNWLWTRKLKVLGFKSLEHCLWSYVVHVTLFSGLLQSLIPDFSKNWKRVEFENLRKGIEAKNPMKKVYMYHMTISFGGFSVSDMNWKGSYRKSCSTKSSFIVLFFLMPSPLILYFWSFELKYFF